MLADVLWLVIWFSIWMICSFAQVECNVSEVNGFFVRLRCDVLLTFNNETKKYIGITVNEFKQGYHNHL